jgi:lipoate-protein ligase A
LKGTGSYKVPNGKLLKVTVELEEDTIKDVQIKGDFFMHPEEGIHLIEDALKGKKIDEGIIDEIDSIINENSIEIYGVDSKSIFEAIKVARDEADEAI